MPPTTQDASIFLLDQNRDVEAAERGDSMPLVGIDSSASASSGPFALSASRDKRSWAGKDNEDYNDEDDELDADENSELNKHRRSEAAMSQEYSPSSGSSGRDQHGDGGENGLHVRDLEQEDEKSFKYYKELPDHTKLHDAKIKAPGSKAIGAGLIVLAGLGYLIAYLCTSVRICQAYQLHCTLLETYIFFVSIDNTLFSRNEGKPSSCRSGLRM
jgi:hypothetical protein